MTEHNSTIIVLVAPSGINSSERNPIQCPSSEVTINPDHSSGSFLPPHFLQYQPWRLPPVPNISSSQGDSSLPQLPLPFQTNRNGSLGSELLWLPLSQMGWCTDYNSIMSVLNGNFFPQNEGVANVMNTTPQPTALSAPLPFSRDLPFQQGLQTRQVNVPPKVEIPQDNSTNIPSSHSPASSICDPQHNSHVPLDYLPSITNNIDDSNTSTTIESDNDCKLFVCHTCHKSYKYHYALAEHIKIHSDQAFVCDICNRRFARSNTLRSHLKSHKGEQPLECHFCLRRFSSQSLLNDHLVKHTTTFANICEYCHIHFEKQVDLDLHINRLHLKQKKHICPICQRAFLYPSDVKKHLPVHDQGKKFICEICNGRFKYKNSLTQHQLKCSPENPLKRGRKPKK